MELTHLQLQSAGQACSRLVCGVIKDFRSRGIIVTEDAFNGSHSFCEAITEAIKGPEYMTAPRAHAESRATELSLTPYL